MDVWKGMVDYFLAFQAATVKKSTVCLWKGIANYLPSLWHSKVPKSGNMEGSRERGEEGREGRGGGGKSLYTSPPTSRSTAPGGFYW